MARGSKPVQAKKQEPSTLTIRKEDVRKPRKKAVPPTRLFMDKTTYHRKSANEIED